MERQGITLRPYQESVLTEIKTLYQQGTFHSLLVMATGMGKTYAAVFLPEVFPHLCKSGLLFLVHRRDIVRQSAESFRRIWPDKKVHIEMASMRADRDADIVVASVQTLGQKTSERIQKFRGRFGAIVVDEAHHCAPDSQYQYILDYFGVGPENTRPLPNGRDRLLVGMTATPNRHDGQGLHMFFDDVAANLDIRWGIDHGYLVDIEAQKISTGSDISEVSTRAGDFSVGELDEAINTHERNEVIVKAWHKYGLQKGLAFCTKIDHARALAEAFDAYGIEAYAIDSKMEKEEREDIMQGYREGAFPVLTNVGIVTEGVDVPETDTILMARPTKSTLLYTQCIGRSTRPIVNPTSETPETRQQQIRSSEKPVMRIIDFTDNTGSHDIMTAPKLFGLDGAFETDKTLTKAARHIEKKEEEHPGKLFRKATSLEEVEIIADQVSVWDVAKTPEPVQKISDLAWMKMNDGVYQIFVPAAHFEQGRDFYLRLEADRLGRYTCTKIKTRVFENGEFKYPRQEKTSDKVYNSKEEAIKACDHYIKRDYHKTLKFINRTLKWRGKPVTKGQKKFLHKLGVHIPEDYELDRGLATDLINAAKASQQ